MNWRYAHTVLLLCMFAFFVTFFARLVFSPIVPFIKDDFGVSNSMIGLSLSGMFLAYGFAQYPSGILADRHGERTIVLLAVGGTGLMSAIVLFAPAYLVFLVGVVVLGGFAGLHYSVATILISRLFDNMGSAIGVHSLGAPLGGLLAPALGAWIGVRYGWRAAVALTVAISIPVFVAFAVHVRPTEARAPDGLFLDGVTLEAIATLLCRRQIAFTVGLAMMATFVINTVISFLPTFLIAHQGLSAGLAGLVFSGYFIGRGVFQLGIGPLSDRYGRDVALGSCLFAGAVGISIYLLGTSVATVAVGTVFAGLGASFFPALEARFLDHIDDADAGSEFGLVRTVYVMVGSTGPLVAGVVADATSWAMAFFLLVVVSLIAVGLLLVNQAFGLEW